MVFSRLRGIILVVAACLAVCAGRASAADPDDTDWTPFVPPAPSTPTVEVPTTSEGGFNRNEQESLLRRLHVSDQLCRGARIPINYVYKQGDFGGSGVLVSRSLAVLSTGETALIDDEQLKANFSHGWGYPVGDQGRMVGSFYVGASIEGHSRVARRTGSFHTCDEVLRLPNFLDAKLVLPVRADRIAAMSLGELWEIPLTLSYWQGGGLSETVAPNATFSISFGRNDSGSASMTLFRIAENKVRFRLRIDHVTVYSQSLGVSASYPALVFAANAKDILMHFLEKQADSQLQHYVTAWMNFGHADTSGDKIMFEFVIDPHDEAQTEALQKAVHGDVWSLLKMAAKMSAFQTEATVQDYNALKRNNESVLGRPTTYKVVDTYTAHQYNLSLNLPLFAAHDAATLTGNDNISLETGEHYTFPRTQKNYNNRFFDLPFMGPQVKESSDRNIAVVTYAPKGSKAQPPFAVFNPNSAYYHMPPSAVTDALNRIDRILSLAGAQRGLLNPRVRLPRQAFDAGAIRAVARNGGILFTLAFNQKAVKDILAASTRQVLEAFSASLELPDRRFMDWIVAHGRVGKNGEINYDWRAARLMFPDEPRPAPVVPQGDTFMGESRAKKHETPIDALDRLSGRAAALLADLASARDAKTNETRAEELRSAMGGYGRSHLSYEEAVRVLIQLIDPMDIRGDFVEGPYHVVLTKGRPEIQHLDEAGRVKNSIVNGSQFPEGD